MVLYKNIRSSSIILTDHGRVATLLNDQTIDSAMDQDSGGRHMDAAALNDPLDNKYAPILAILYDENKIDVLRGTDYSTRIKITVDKWNSDPSSKQGFVALLPYSDFFVTAKQGETKIWFKNYITEGVKDRSLETALRSIMHISSSPEHKVLSVFDWELSAMIQFFVPEIRCGDDPLITKCSSVSLNDNVSCIENAHWNKVDRKCFCKGGFFLDTNTRTCKKCQCMDKD